MVPGLKEPQGLQIDFRPSPKQYEVWQNLQPECPLCGGEVTQKMSGVDRNGNPTFKPVCSKCGNENIPQMILTGGAAGGGKQGLLDSEVCTPFGFRKIRDLQVGSIITNPITGGMQRIIWLHPIEKHPYYRVYFVDKTYFDCSEGHLWKCHLSRNKSKRSKKNDIDIDRIWTTKEMFDWYQRKRNGMYNSYNLIIPLTAPVRFTIGNKKPIIDPYVLGAIIGDGCIADSVIEQGCVQFTTMDQEIVDRFISAGYDMSKSKQKPNSRAKDYRICDKDLVNEIKKLGIAGNKSQSHTIPYAYKYASIENRIKLMQGLIDTDGYVDKRGHIVYTSTSKSLADDVAFIVRSLGGVATITKSKAGYKKNGKYIQCSDAYDVQIRTKINPDLCGLTRKKELAKYEFNGGASELGKRIIDIEYIGIKEGRCITVDDPSGLYVANDFTVTHNSYLGSCWLISSCLRWPDMRMVVGRKTLKSLRESTWNTILSVCKSWGLVENEHFKVNNLSGEMIFWNGSKIIMKEMAYSPSDPSWLRFGSSEYSGGFIDEVGEIEERGVDVLFSRIRWKVHETFKVPKLLMSTNPCLGWVRDRFVIDNNGEPVKCREGELYLPFSVFDNPDIAFRNAYAASLRKINDPTTVERLLYGNWMWVDSNEAAAYWKFDGAKHLVDNLKEKVYNPLKPIILSFDFNVIPFMSCLSLQIDYDNKKVYVLEEILGRPESKDNNTPKLAQKVRTKYLNEQHTGGLFVTGDPAGLARSTQTEDGVNNFTIIMNNLDHPVLRPKKKLLKRQPSQVARLDFVNALFDGYDGWEILIDMRCRKFTEDLIYQKKNADGTKSKAKTTDPKLGVKYEKYGHLSDCFDYFLCLFLSESWGRFQSKNSGITTTVTPIYNNFSF